MNIFSSVMKFLSSLTRPKPVRDWLFGLTVVSVLFMCLVFYSVSLYLAISSGNAFTAEGKVTTIPAITLTRGDIEAVLETYRTRSVNYTAHNLPSPAVVDPAK